MRTFLFFAIFTVVSFGVNGQSWDLTTTDRIQDLGQKDIKPTIFRVFKVNNEDLLKILRSAPQEGTVSDALQSQVIIPVGMPSGKIENFSLVKYNLLAPALQAQFPDILAFYGVGTSDPNVRIVADYSPMYGFRAVIYYPDGNQVFVDHYQRNDLNHRLVYNRKDFRKFDRWTCEVEESNLIGQGNRNSMIGDCLFREYRLALACTGEYGVFHGGTTAGALAAMNTSMNRINGVFAQEFAIRFTIIANNNLIIYLNGATDPYTNGTASAMITENQTNCTNVIGTANFDVGHLFGTGGSGLASLNAVCSSGNKARGITGIASPVGDPYDIDYVAHEMGHQLGGNHTQNNNCNRSNASAMEPGSASSIMGYAGICAPNVAANSDPYFHARSLQEIKTFLSGSGSNCDIPVAGYVNSPPVISAPANTTNYKVPISTPFVLTMTATDPDGQSILYGWDQMDNTVATMPPASTNTAGPAFRFIDPTTNPSRYLPNLTAILSGATVGAPYAGNNWEVIPSVARLINFRGVARDITPMSASCNSEVNVSINTIAAAGPFIITSQNTATTWAAGTTQTITWNVAGTTANTINCANVDVIWSSTNAFTAPITLAASVANDGSQDIIVPNQVTTTGRIMVKAVGNIFLDINNANITVTGGLPCPGALVLSSPANNATAIALKPTLTWGLSSNATTYDVQLSRKSDFSSSVLSFSNIAATTFDVTAELDGFSEYSWRVRGSNSCGAGTWSPSFKFNTEPCLSKSSVDVPILISGSGTPTINSTLTFGNARDRGTINDLDIKNLTGLHSWVGDLTFKLFAPNGTNVLFWEQPCGNFDDFNMNFDQAAFSSTTPCPPTTGGVIKPSGINVGSLNAFNNLDFNGIWNLQIQDLVDHNAGELQSWSIRTCLNNFCRLTVDNDFEKGAGSLLAAINCAVDGDTIRFAPSFMNDTITLFNSNLVTSKRLFIDADPAKNIHVTSTSTQPTLVSSAPNTQEGLKIRGLYMHSSLSTNVGAIQNSGLLNMIDVTLYRDTGGAAATIRNEVGGINNLSGSCKVLP